MVGLVGLVRWGLVGSAGLALGTAVVGLSSAAFTATTTSPANTFSTGTVALTDDDGGTAMFAVSGLKPGSTGTSCVLVTYGGSLRAAVTLFVASGDHTGTGLGSYLNLRIEEGSGGTSASCAGFTAGRTDWNGTLAALASSATTAATGVGAFAPTGAGQSRTYRFTWTLADDNAAQGLTSAVRFTWQATST